MIIRSRPEERHPEDLPGPGNYELPEASSSKGFTIGQKKEHKIPSGPGPGQYEGTPKQTLKSFTIGTRKQERPLEDLPGPGAYPEHSPQKEGVLLRGRPASPRHAEGPGPGAYDNYNPSSTGGWTIAERRPDRQPEENPGPGAYE